MADKQAVTPAEIGQSIFGMLSSMFAALSATVITTAVKGTKLIDKTLNVAINSVSAAENITEAVEKRSKIYGEGMVRNGALAERESELKHILRLRNLEKQESSVGSVAPQSETVTPTIKTTKAKAKAKATK